MVAGAHLKQWEQSKVIRLRVVGQAAADGREELWCKMAALSIFSYCISSVFFRNLSRGRREFT